MMLASTYYPQHIHTFAPPRPSPLSERSANAVPRLFNFTMASQPTDQGEKKLVVPQRAYKANPLLQTRDAATQRRRNMFFKRVQQDRDDKKWQARGEQIQRLDFISEKKRWEAEKAREAPSEADYFNDDTLNEAIQSQTPNNAQPQEQQMTEADYILAQEEDELQELISSMEDVEETASQHYGSDDEDYDQLFMEYINAADLPHLSQSNSNNWDVTEDMDMSEG